MQKIPPPYTDPANLFRHGGQAPAGALDFSASINPLGPPASVLTAIQRALPDIARYPDPACRELTARLAALHGVAPEQIVVGNGSNELIHAIARAFAPKRVAIAEPTYTEYLRASLMVGAEVDHWLAEGSRFKFTPFDPGKARLVWLCNPNNPTGGMWASARHLLQWVKSHPRSMFVVDEAFEPFCRRDFQMLRGYPSSLLWHQPLPSNLIVLRSLTKFYALPGLRLGYAVCPLEWASLIREEQPTWSVNTLAQTAGLAALEDRSFWGQTRDWLLEQSALFTGPNARWRQFRPMPFAANFLLARIEGISSCELARRLTDRGILIRDASNFVGLDEHYIRISIRSREENERLLTELRAILGS